MCKTKTLYSDKITLEVLDDAFHSMLNSEKNEMNCKIQEIIYTMDFAFYENRLLAQHMLTLGYLAAHLEKVDEKKK